MNTKRGISLGVFILGAIFIMLALHGMQQVHEAKKNISTEVNKSDAVSISPMMGRLFKQKVGEYDGKLTGLLVCGMILLIGGSSALLWLRNR